MPKRKQLKKGETACIVCDENPCRCPTPPKMKCDKDDICGSLLRHLNVEANRGKGLSSVVFTNLAPDAGKLFGATRFAGVAYRDVASDSGVFINYCPWCGKSLRHFLKAKNWSPR